MLKTIAELAEGTEDLHIRKDPRMSRVTIFAGKTAVCSMAPESREVQSKFFLWNLELVKGNRISIGEATFSKEEAVEKATRLLDRPEDAVQWSV